MEIAVNLSPMLIFPCLCKIAILADKAVPVGDLSIFPGFMATADLKCLPLLPSNNEPQKWQKEKWFQSEYVGSVSYTHLTLPTIYSV